MRHFFPMPIALSVALSLMASPWAEAWMRPPREVPYQGERVWVRIAKDQMTKIVFPDPLPPQSFPVRAHEVGLSRDTMDTRQLIVQGIDPPEYLEFTVNTTRQPYLIALRRATQAPDSVVAIVHPPTSSPAVDGEPTSLVPPIRSLWITQWRGDPTRPEPGVTLRPVRGTLADQADRSLTYRYAVEGFGYYGWTLAVVNKSPHRQVVPIEQIEDAAGRLISVMVQHLDRSPGDLASLRLIEPQETVLLHLLYQEGDP